LLIAVCSPVTRDARVGNAEEFQQPVGFGQDGVAAMPNRRKEVGMAVTEILTLLACVLAVLCFLAWRWNFPN
jgi:hypothetical protein